MAMHDAERTLLEKLEAENPLERQLGRLREVQSGLTLVQKVEATGAVDRTCLSILLTREDALNGSLAAALQALQAESGFRVESDRYLKQVMDAEKQDRTEVARKLQAQLNDEAEARVSAIEGLWAALRVLREESERRPTRWQLLKAFFRGYL